MNKKRIFGIVVFIILGLFMFTFANPLNEKGDDNQPKEASGSKTIANNDSKDVTNNTPASNNEANTERNNTTNGNTRNVNRNVNNQTGTLNGFVQNNEQSNVQPTAQEATVAPVASEQPVAPVQPVELKPEPVQPVEPVKPEKPEREEPIVPKPVDLTIDKLNAIQELKDYRKSYEFTDDSEYKDTIEEFSRAINDAESFIDIKNALNEGKKAIDELINKDLEAYKEAAKKEIQDYADSLLLVTDVTELLDGYYGDIDEATTKSAIDEIVEDAKAELDKIKQQEIDKAKKDAINTINEYKKDDEKNISEIVNVKNEAKEDIDEVNDLEKIQEIVDKAKEDIDSIINNKKFTVTFYGLMNKVIKTETVAYKAAATTLKMNATQTGWNG